MRETTKEMEELCDAALEYVKMHDQTAPVEAFNSVVFLAYYENTGVGKWWSSCLFTEISSGHPRGKS